MRLEELDFEIPEGMIAQRPAMPRDSCRLLFVDAQGGTRHGSFAELPDVLRPGDMLVLNDSRVMLARVPATRRSGGRVELLFLRAVDGEMKAGETRAVGEVWEVLARPSQRLRQGAELTLSEEHVLVLRERLGEGRWLVEGPPRSSMTLLMDRYGRLPLPPYIKVYPDDPRSYQTVYAARSGSAAAPTAGLHFTPGLLERLRLSGIRSACVTLHVGLDTFQPIRKALIEEHRIHREAYQVSQAALETIRGARSSGGRLVAVGTTAARVLETLAARGVLDGEAGLGSVSGFTEIFITPGYRFKAVDALLTNFHLPCSTVLAMVMAFAGVERIRNVYREAMDLGYRFFSFGDAMLIEAPTHVGSGGKGR